MKLLKVSGIPEGVALVKSQSIEYRPHWSPDFALCEIINALQFKLLSLEFSVPCGKKNHPTDTERGKGRVLDTSLESHHQFRQLPH